MKATKYQKKSQIKLEDLLRKRKTNLDSFLKERGITTYESLDRICKRLGVLTPDQNSFFLCVEKYVSNPSAGVVVIPPPVVLHENTGEPETVDDAFEDFQPQISVISETEAGSVSIVLKEAMMLQEKQLSKKQKKQLKKQQEVKQ
jgi:hypothetical protein